MTATKHPGEATLALYAGGDLGPIARWRTERHIRRCEACQEEVLAFQEVRQMVADLSDMPDVPWNRLAAEMQANIRLGLAAGECVREAAPQPASWKPVFGFRAAVATACVTLLIAAGVVLQRPIQRQAEQSADVALKGFASQMVRATTESVQLNMGSQTVDLKHDSGIQNADYSASATRLTETYVDPITGNVMVNSVAY